MDRCFPLQFIVRTLKLYVHEVTNQLTHPSDIFVNFALTNELGSSFTKILRKSSKLEFNIFKIKNWEN